jgi:5-methylcytosine-specific restriction endonuclease McrA
MSDFLLSSPLPPERIYANQTAILKWLKSLGHAVEFVRDYEGAALVRHRLKTNTVRPTTYLGGFIDKPCPYCDEPMTAEIKRQPTRDHKNVPRSKGGKLNLPGNKIICCRQCNGDKGSHSLREWLEALAMRNDPRCLSIKRLLLAETDQWQNCKTT